MLEDGQRRLAVRILAISQTQMLPSCNAYDTQAPLLLEKQILTNSQPASLVLALPTEQYRIAFDRNISVVAPVLDRHRLLREGSCRLPSELTPLARDVCRR